MIQQSSQKGIRMLTLNCECGSLGHCIVLSSFEGIEEEFLLSYQIDTVSLWNRLKSALRYLFKGDPIWIEEIALSRGDLERFKSSITEMLKHE